MAKSLAHIVATVSSRPAVDGEPGVPELIEPRIERSRSVLNGSRLNVVLPVIIERYSYGGIVTALRLFESLAAGFTRKRIVLLNQTEAEFDFAEWRGWRADDGGTASRSIAFLGDESTPLQIAEGDFFLATAWTTAVYVKHAAARHAELFPGYWRRFVYFIQDFEPGFYPWSSRYLYAESTYRERHRIIAVFNSQLLADNFRARKLDFSERHVYEPMLDPRIRKRKPKVAVHKERLILVYGRPSSPRNAFELIVEALKIWARTFPRAGEWTVLSVGEQHAELRLGESVVLESRGKLSIEAYAEHLSRCWLGLSLMVSPHPSYPPLEMAEFGAWVVTNRFENKDLSERAANIFSVEDLSPESIASRISWCCSQYRPGRTAVLDTLAPVFRNDAEEFPFARALVSSWQADTQSRQAE